MQGKGQRGLCHIAKKGGAGTSGGRSHEGSGTLVPWGFGILREWCLGLVGAGSESTQSGEGFDLGRISTRGLVKPSMQRRRQIRGSASQELTAISARLDFTEESLACWLIMPMYEVSGV